MTHTARVPDVPAALAALDKAARYLIVRTAHLSVPCGSRGSAAYDLPVLADNADGSAVTLHNYGSGPELQCNCDAFEPSRGCAHVAQAQAQRVTPNLARGA